MVCEVQKRGDAIHVSGDMTIYEAMSLRDALFEALDREPGRAIVDVSHVAEIDTTGVQILIVAQRTCTARGESFTLANPSTVVRETLELMRVNSLPFASVERAGT